MQVCMLSCIKFQLPLAGIGKSGKWKYDGLVRSNGVRKHSIVVSQPGTSRFSLEMRVGFCFRDYYFLFRPVIMNVSWDFMSIELRLNVKINASEK